MNISKADKLVMQTMATITNWDNVNKIAQACGNNDLVRRIDATLARLSAQLTRRCDNAMKERHG